jgi:hypothetical protein
MADLGNGNTHSANSLILGGIGQPLGSYGGTGSGATFINPTYFVAGTGILNVSSSSCSTGSWLGSASVDWFNGANWCGGVVPTATDNVTILAGTPFAPTISAAAVCNNITINAGATVTITGTNTLTVSGNWTNNGTLSGSTGVVIFDGTAQTISGTGAFTNLSIAPLTSGTTTLNANTTVNGTLDLATTGTIDLNTFQSYNSCIIR